MEHRRILQNCNFGSRVAEEEIDELSSYFVRTGLWERVCAGQIDIVYGAKGAGKSAIHALLLANSDQFQSTGVRVVCAERPRGTPVFRRLQGREELSENEFMFLWQLYFLSLIDGILEKEDVDSSRISHFLVSNGLSGPRTLPSVLQSIVRYVRQYFRAPSGVEATVNVDQSGAATGVTGRITFNEPATKDPDGVSIRSLLEFANQCLCDCGVTAWILLDRLDVAFAESLDTEKVALRALFRAYLDMLDLDAISPKIFLRTDIWTRITEEGFREGSHITRSETITWDRDSLMNLVVRRLIASGALCEHYQVEHADVLSDIRKQFRFFYRVFPEQIDLGTNQAKTWDWILTRTVDGSRQYSPREVIHLLNEARRCQLGQMAMGATEDLEDDGTLFARSAIRDSLNEVSRVRLNQTLYAEWPDIRSTVEQFRREHATHDIESIVLLLDCSTAEAGHHVASLVRAGFLEPVGKNPARFRVPFLYRSALEIGP